MKCDICWKDFQRKLENQEIEITQNEIEINPVLEKWERLDKEPSSKVKPLLYGEYGLSTEQKNLLTSKLDH